MKTKTPPARSDVIVPKQMLDPIPIHLINRRARETGVAAQARSFSVLRHLAAMFFVRLAHSRGRNDIRDRLHRKSEAFGRFGVTPSACGVRDAADGLDGGRVDSGVHDAFRKEQVQSQFAR